MLKIKNLTAVFDDLQLLDDINLEINEGELHTIIGPERSGKSSLAHTIMGNPKIAIKDGSITYRKKSILEKTVDDRSVNGIFVSAQHPPNIDGVSNFNLVKTILKIRKDTRTPNELEKEYKDLCKKLGLSSNHGHKVVNHAIMSDTECKKNELLHILLLKPDLIVFDEIDTGIEPDEFDLFASCIKEFLSDKSKSAIIITHSRELLDALQPTHVHVMVDGEIRETGATELYKRILEDGYSQFS
jgi:Fe-S cluster assembly ATP-binding protein